MKASLIRIGNSKGIRLPKPVIEQCHLTDEVEMEVSEGKIIIYAVGKARSGWDEAFERMADKGDDVLLDPPAVTAWDESDWQWK